MATEKTRIDSLRRADGSLDRSGLLEVLPYGEDFLFVDRVNHLSSTEVEAGFSIPETSTYLQSHFVDLAVMPGVLIGEGLAQAGSLIVRYNLPAGSKRHVLGLEIERARFLSPAQPGEILTYRAHLATSSRRVARLEGDVTVAGRKVCQARIVVAIVPDDKLREQLAAQSGEEPT